MSNRTVLKLNSSLLTPISPFTTVSNRTVLKLNSSLLTPISPFTTVSNRTVLKLNFFCRVIPVSFTTVSNRTVLKPRNHSNYSIFNSWMSLSEVYLALNEQSHHCVSSQSSIMIYPSSNKKSDDFINVRLTMSVNAHQNVVLTTFN